MAAAKSSSCFKTFFSPKGNCELLCMLQEIDWLTIVLNIYGHMYDLTSKGLPVALCGLPVSPGRVTSRSCFWTVGRPCGLPVSPDRVTSRSCFWTVGRPCGLPVSPDRVTSRSCFWTVGRPCGLPVSPDPHSRYRGSDVANIRFSDIFKIAFLLHFRVTN